MLALGGKLPDGTQFLSPATLRAALVNRTPGAGHEFRGLGFNLAGSPSNFLGDLMSPRAYGHTGFTGTSIAVDPDTGLFVVLLTNRVCPTGKNGKLHPHAFADPQCRGRRGRTHAAGGAAMELICRAAAQADLPACAMYLQTAEIYERYFSAPGHWRAPSKTH